MERYLTVKSHHEGYAATITLNRPDQCNAFDDTLLAEFIALLAELETDEKLRVLIITANGKYFSAGADLTWMQAMVNYTPQENRDDANQLATFLHTLYTFKKPTICLIQGPAFGGALGIIAACDIAIASDAANFCFSEVKMGLIPATISPYLSNKCQQHLLRRYFLTAEKFDTDVAKRMGLIHDVTDESSLLASRDALIKKLLNNSPAALTGAKQLLALIAPIDLPTREKTVELIAEARTSPEGQEGIKAFLEKRKANWIP